MHRPRPNLLTAFLLLPALLFAACGGGGGGGPDAGDAGALFSTTLLGDPGRDGWVSSAGDVSTALNPIVGDRADDVAYRGVFAFDLAHLPAGARIVSATLRIYQGIVLGTPYQTHGPLVLDHIDMGTNLDAGDYTGSNVRAAFAVLSRDATTDYYDVDVSARIQADLAAGRTHAAFRARFGSLGSDNDGVYDLASLTDAEDSDDTGHVPHILVRYELP